MKLTHTLVAGVALTIALGAGTAQAAGNWNVLYSKKIEPYSDLHTVIATAADQGWAMNGDGDLLRYAAGSWKKSTAITPDTLAKSAAGTAWAFSSPGSGKTLHAWSFDGSAWVDHPLKAAADSYLEAQAVGGDDDVWVATDRTLAHYDGSSWTTMKKPAKRIAELTVAGPGDVWAVGEGKDGPGKQPQLLHWTGGKWRQVAAPKIPLPKPIYLPVDPGKPNGKKAAHIPQARINDLVALSPKDVWAVGTVTTWLCCDDRVYGREVVLHYDGTSWKRLDIPSTKINLKNVVGDGKGGAWITAEPYGIKKQPYLLHYTGGKWSKVTLPKRPKQDDYHLQALSAVPGAGRVWVFAEVGLNVPTGQLVENVVFDYSL